MKVITMVINMWYFYENNTPEAITLKYFNVTENSKLLHTVI